MKCTILLIFMLISLPVKSQRVVTVTTYNAVKNQCDSNPTVTANGTKVREHLVKSGRQRICAVSRDLLKTYPYGTLLHIEGHGYYQVCDTMNKRFSNRVDLLIPKDSKHFKKENVKVTKCKKH